MSESTTTDVIYFPMQSVCSENAVGFRKFRHLPSTSRRSLGFYVGECGAQSELGLSIVSFAREGVYLSRSHSPICNHRTVHNTSTRDGFILPSPGVSLRPHVFAHALRPEFQNLCAPQKSISQSPGDFTLSSLTSWLLVHCSSIQSYFSVDLHELICAIDTNSLR